MGNGRMKTLADKFQLAVHLQTVNAKVEKINQIQINLQISTDLETTRDS
jgi:hypothetical protein